MNARSIVRRTATAVAGGLGLLVGSAVIVGLPAAQAVPPPHDTQAIALPASTTVVSIAQVSEDAAATELTLQGFAGELEGAGLLLSEYGSRILSTRAGLGTPRQLVLSQMAADRFGIVRNPFFDPARVAVVFDGEALADLSTGVITGHRIGSAGFGTTELIAASLLEELRARAGWSITSAREAEAARYAKVFGGYIPFFLQSDEAYAAYKERARANYTALAEAG